MADKIVVEPKEDAVTTGNFDVTVLGTGQVLHSKKRMFAGQGCAVGRAESHAEKMAILQQIQEILNEEEDDDDE